MGIIREPEPVKLFVSMIALGDDAFQYGVKELCSDFGEVDTLSDRLPFDFTEYYTREMGKPLFRHFVTFERLIPMRMLPDIKLATNRLERNHSTPAGNRQINIDPGYICLEHVILATTKGYSHRPYLRDGIYADLTLIYRNKSFQPLEWTYPDYRQEGVINLFNQFRKKYSEDLKERSQASC